jgi:murein endopeptidase
LPSVTVTPAPHPLDGVPASELRRIVREEPERLGPAIVGRPNRGQLFNSALMPEGSGWRVVNPERSFGTDSVVRSIARAIEEVRAEFTDTRPLDVGDISRERGGYLRPHRSHQTGLDADLGYYYTEPVPWYTPADAGNFDASRTWALIKALIAQGNVQYVFVDRSLQALLARRARSIGEHPVWIDELFEGTRRRPALIRHLWGHRTHFHVRFFDHVAEETGQRAAKHLRHAGKSR